eukprot:1147972-Pelagomonas_calceolata.AAC.4
MRGSASANCSDQPAVANGGNKRCPGGHLRSTLHRLVATLKIMGTILCCHPINQDPVCRWQHGKEQKEGQVRPKAGPAMDLPLAPNAPHYHQQHHHLSWHQEHQLQHNQLWRVP